MKFRWICNWSIIYTFEIFTNFKFKTADIENEGIPFPDSFFDFVYSKSFIEYFHNQEKLIKEICRVLKPGGKAIPFTHRSILTIVFILRTIFTGLLFFESLRDIQLINGYVEVQDEFF